MTISTSYRLQVNPSGTVAPGTRLTVSSVGGGCDAISQAAVGLWRPIPVSSPWRTETEIGQNGGEGPVGGSSWTVSFVVAPTVTPGSDDVTAACRHSRGFSVTYQPVPITVS